MTCQERRDDLELKYGFVCQCDWCKGNNDGLPPPEFGLGDE